MGRSGVLGRRVGVTAFVVAGVVLGVAPRVADAQVGTVVVDVDVATAISGPSGDCTTDPVYGTVCATPWVGAGVSIAEPRAWILTMTTRTYHSPGHIGWCHITGTWRLTDVLAPATYLAGSLEKGTTPLCSVGAPYMQVTDTGGAFAGYVDALAPPGWQELRDPGSQLGGLHTGVLIGSLRFVLVPG